jgi:methylenetetrahydrofolate dehydrogenase (NADP+)/methenyltetrahydrofolate cyclohydrolase
LTVVLVGEDPASRVYVGSKTAAAREAGIAENDAPFPRMDLPEKELLSDDRALNADDAVDAILVQLPLPSHIDTRRVLEAVDPRKDADGFHPLNAGLLAQGRPAPVALHPRRDHGSPEARGDRALRACGLSSSAAATSWASRWRAASSPPTAR